MASKYIDIKTVKFFMNNVQELEKILNKERFVDYNIESVDLYIESVKKFADRELFPYIKEMDEKPAHYKDGSIHVHQQVGKMMKEGGAMGLISAPFNYEDGGLQLPLLVHTAANYILDAANNHLPGYSGLTSGAAELIIEFASKELKELEYKEINNNQIEISFSKFGLLTINNSALKQSIEIVRRRIDDVGTKEPTILQRGEKRILVELPGLKDPERIKPY